MTLSPLFLSSRGDFSRRGICFSDFFSGLFRSCRKTLNLSKTPLNSLFLVPEPDWRAKAASQALEQWRRLGER